MITTVLDELRKDIDRDLRNFNKLTDINVVFNSLETPFDFELYLMQHQAKNIDLNGDI